METAEGLRGTLVGESRLSRVDEETTTFSYRGYNVEELAGQCSFEEGAYLLWHGYLPTQVELQELRAHMRLTRQLEEPLKKIISDLPKGAPPMSVMRTALSAAGVLDQKADRAFEHASLEMAERLVAKSASIVAAQWRRREDLEIIAPHAKLDHAANFLYMLTGEEPSELAAKVLDTCLFLYIDHGFNASAFTARVAASTLSDMYSAVTAAIGTLRGRLHGGANEMVMEMLKEIEEPERAERYVLDALAHGREVAGFGHVVYEKMDPRARIIKALGAKLARETNKDRLMRICQIVEDVMLRETGLFCNAAFYVAPVLSMLGIHRVLHTPIFALGRVVGYTAHVLEQYENNTLIRPRCKYTGDGNRKFVPIDER